MKIEFGNRATVRLWGRCILIGGVVAAASACTGGPVMVGVRSTCLLEKLLSLQLGYIGIIYSFDMCSICILSVNPYWLGSASKSPFFFSYFINMPEKRTKRVFADRRQSAAKRFIVLYIRDRTHFEPPLRQLILTTRSWNKTSILNDIICSHSNYNPAGVFNFILSLPPLKSLKLWALSSWAESI